MNYPLIPYSLHLVLFVSSIPLLLEYVFSLGKIYF